MNSITWIFLFFLLQVCPACYLGLTHDCPWNILTMHVRLMFSSGEIFLFLPAYMTSNWYSSICTLQPKSSVVECIFMYLALHFECRFNKKLTPSRLRFTVFCLNRREFLVRLFCFQFTHSANNFTDFNHEFILFGALLDVFFYLVPFNFFFGIV